METYQVKLNEVLKKFETQIEGLKGSRILDLQRKYGKNITTIKKRFSGLKLFFSQFLNLMAGILLIAAVLSFAIGSAFDCFVILGIILLNAIIGFFQEYRAEKLVEALERIVPQNCVVVREGIKQEIGVLELVPGDIVVLDEGDNVPADIRLLESFNFQTNDFVLTGESTPQAKFSGNLDKKNLSLSEIDNMVFLGMTVATGSAKGVVVATGLNTEFGKIAKITAEIKDELSPLQKQIAVLGKTVTKITLAVVFVLFGVFYFTNGYLDFYEAFQFAIGVASATVPEGLVATVSVALALGVSRMAKKNAIVKKLSATETLGTTTVICTDKTGTLTKNEMTAKKLFFDFVEYQIGGDGYEACGEVCANNQKITKQEEKELLKLIDCGVMCNNAEFYPHTLVTDNGGIRINLFSSQTKLFSDKSNNKGVGVNIVGDQTEGSLLVLAHKFGIDPIKLTHENKRMFELPFDSTRKMMSTVNLVGSKYVVNTKGAPQEVLANCTHIFKNGKVQKISANDLVKINAKNDELANGAYRILALAQKEVSKDFKKEQTELENNLVFLGLVAIIDPPRAEIKKAIKDAQSAGIRVIMITGDYGLTARAIGEQIGMGSNVSIISGSELKVMSDKKLIEELYKNIEQSIIFARVAPEDKMRITGLLQKQGEIVAMTGDGVNDAPALRKADVGVAMGITGTDVSKEASDIVLADDNFSSIVAAIEEGRKIYANLKKFILYIFSSNATEFFTVFFGVFVGVSPILALQILLIDLGTDILPSLALAQDPSTKNVMKESPRNAREKLLDKKILIKLLRIGVVIGVGALFAFIATLMISGWSFGQNISTELYARATTVTYATLVLCQMVNSFLCRDDSLPFWKLIKGNKMLWWATLGSLILLLNLVYNPYIQPLAHTAALGAIDWMLALIVALTFLLVEDGVKFVRALRKPKQNILINLLKKPLLKIRYFIKIRKGSFLKKTIIFLLFSLKLVFQIVNNFSTKNRKLYSKILFIIFFLLFLFLILYTHNNYEKIFTNNAGNSSFEIKKTREIKNAIIKNSENGETVFESANYRIDKSIARWGDFLFFSDNKTHRSLMRYDLITKEKKVVFTDNYVSGEGATRTITDIAVVNNVLFFTLGEYMIKGDAYFFDSPFSAPTKINSEKNSLPFYEVEELSGKTIILGGYGDACFGIIRANLIDLEKNNLQKLYESNTGCSEGSEFLGYTKESDIILTYHYALKDKPDSQNTYYEKVDIASIDNPKSTKELISKDQMPNDIRGIAYDEKKEQLILIGKDIYFYKLAGEGVENIASLDIPKNWELGYFNFIGDNVCINIMESIGVDEIDYNVWQFLVNIENKTILNNIKSCEKSWNKKIKEQNEKDFAFMGALNLPKNLMVFYEYSDY